MDQLLNAFMVLACLLFVWLGWLFLKGGKFLDRAMSGGRGKIWIALLGETAARNVVRWVGGLFLFLSGLFGALIFGIQLIFGVEF